MNVDLHLIDFRQPTNKVLDELEAAWIERDITEPGCCCSVSPMPPCYHCESSHNRFYEWLVDAEEDLPQGFYAELIMKGYIQ